MFANQVRHAAYRIAYAQVDARLAEVHRLELGVAVGKVQEVHLSAEGAASASGASSTMPLAAAMPMTCMNSRRFKPMDAALIC
jgi:hypothetical protein